MLLYSENYFLFLLEIGSFEQPSFQWRSPNLLFFALVAGIVVEVADTTVDKVVVVVAYIVAVVVEYLDKEQPLVLERSLVDLSRRNSDDSSILDCKYLSKGCSVSKS